MVGILPKFDAKMLGTIEKMKEEKVSFMNVEGADGFFVTTDDEQKDAIVLGSKKVGEEEFFLCQKSE